VKYRLFKYWPTEEAIVILAWPAAYYETQVFDNHSVNSNAREKYFIIISDEQIDGGKQVEIQVW